jgi:serine/threonine-protein kinase
VPGKKLRFGEFEADFGRRELRKCGVRVGLQHKPFRVLELLLRKPGELVTREELSAFLWPDSHVSFERGLNTAVNSLRQVLGDSSRECRFIETRAGLGYAFCANVEEVVDAKANHAHNNVEAYQDYLKGRYFLDRVAEEEVHKAIAHFKAAATDENCAAIADAGLADAYCQLALLGALPASDLIGRTRHFAERAVTLDPSLSNGHVSLARVKMLFDWDWQGAQATLDRALDLAPCSTSAHTLQAELLRLTGRNEEALRRCRQALSYEPLSFSANLQLANCLYAARDFKKTVDQCWKMLTLESRFTPAQLLLAMSYEQLGMYEEAIVEFWNAQNCSGFWVAAFSGLAHAYSLAGLTNEMEKTAVELAEKSCMRFISNYWQALVCMARNQREEAIASLEAALRQRDPALLSLRSDPRFDLLREDSRFDTISAALGVDVASSAQAV